MLETSFLKFKLLDEGGGAGSGFGRDKGAVPSRFGTFQDVKGKEVRLMHKI